MSVEYRAGVFFGTWVPVDTPLGERLDERIDDDGGTLAESGTEGIELDRVGSQSCGPLFVAICAENGSPFGRRVKQPVLLSDAAKETRWKDALTAFFMKEGIDPASLPPVGWYFAGSVS